MFRELPYVSVVVLAAVTLLFWFPREARSQDICNAYGPRVDCGYSGIQEGDCDALKCCWSPAIYPSGAPRVDLPWCYKPNTGASIYNVTAAADTGFGRQSSLQLVLATAPELGQDVEELSVTVRHRTENILQVKIGDRLGQRWQVPTFLYRNDSLIAASQPAAGLDPDHVIIQYDESTLPYGFKVFRKGTGETLFDSTPFRMVYKDQYIELTTIMPEKASLYGLGERTHSQGLQIKKDGIPLTLWARDWASLFVDTNLYGSHPFVMVVMPDGKAHGIYLHNSNGMEVVITNTTLSYRIVGGIPDLYFLAGPTPVDVMQQYTAVIGKPAMPPRWALGFHQCRWGYNTIGETWEVVKNYSAAGIPLEVMWSDIDAMEERMDFTVSPHNFPLADVQNFLSELHSNNQKWVPIIDPGIKIQPGYLPYEEGLAMNVFLKDVTGSDYVGEVWPGATHFPDFHSPSTQTWWTRSLKRFKELVDFDGLWIDMNEVANFCTGDVCTYIPAAPSNGSNSGVHNFADINSPAANCQCLRASEAVPEKAEEFDRLTDPPYQISNGNARLALSTRTGSMTAQHYDGSMQYDTHNLYGFAEAVATYNALQEIQEDRPFILSRSTFPGAGAVTGHWTGDNGASWNDLQYSITGVLNFNLFGIPFVGSDICGFSGDTTEELCNRWILAGAFHPFSRNHAMIGTSYQELYRWDSVADAGRQALSLRYRLLPYFYSSFYASHALGLPVAWPLWMMFPQEAQTHAIDRQWLFGESIMVAPVLEEGATKVQAYFPRGTWYAMHNASRHNVINSQGGQDGAVILDAPLGVIPVYILGARIIPMQDFHMTTTQVSESPLTLVVALPQTNTTTAFDKLLWARISTADTRHSYHTKHPESGIRSGGIAARKLLNSPGDDEFRRIVSVPLIGCGTVGQGTASACGHMYWDNGKQKQVSTLSSSHLSFYSIFSSDGSGNVLITWGQALLEDYTCAGGNETATLPVLRDISILGLHQFKFVGNDNAIQVQLQTGSVVAVKDGFVELAVEDNRVLSSSNALWNNNTGQLNIRNVDIQLQCPSALLLSVSVARSAHTDATSAFQSL